MIKYKLNCKKCQNTFDSWFASSREFEKLKKIGLINCSKCNSLNVEKSIGRSTLMNVTKKNFEGKPISKIKVNIKKLDTVIKDSKTKGFYGIKIDVEGYELEVLKGAKKREPTVM